MATQNNYMWNKKIPASGGTYSLILTNAAEEEKFKENGLQLYVRRSN